MWDRYSVRPAAGATGSSGRSAGGLGGLSAATGPTAITGLQLVEGAAMGLGPGAAEGGRTGPHSSVGAPNHHHSSRASSLTASARAGPQKKLTPPPQLHERVLLKGQQYRQSQQPHQLQTQQHQLHQQQQRHQSQQPQQTQQLAQPQYQQRHQSLNPQQRERQPQTQHLRLHLRGGQAQQQQGQGGQQQQHQRPGPVRGGGHSRGAGNGSFPYSNSNRDFSNSIATNTIFSTSTRHHQTFWPDDFRNPRGGLGIEHNLPSPTTPKFEVRRGVIQRTDIPERKGSAEDTLDELLPPPNFHSTAAPGDVWRPASSIYSDNRDSFASPITPNFANVAAPNTYTSAVADISPPSSPDVDARRDGTPTQGRDVSPIDESPDLSQLDINGNRQQPGQHGTPPSHQKSNIPMMRRERRKNQDAAAHTLRETKSQQRLRIQRETKWDDMTGEPTSLDTGRAGQVRPQEFAQEFGQGQPFGKSAAAMKAMQNAPQTNNAFGDRLRRLRPIGGSPKGQQQPPSATAAAPEPIEERPPWRGASGLRGASGRTAIVNPVRDTAPAEPISVPRRSSKRIAVGPRLPIAGVSSPLSPVSSPSESETSPRTKTPTIRTVLSGPPRKLTASPSPTATATRTPPPPAQSSYPSPPNSGAGIQSPVHATLEATNSADAGVTTRQPASLPGLPAAPTAYLGTDKAIRRKPPPANSQALHAPQPSFSSSVYSEATAQAPSTHEKSPPREPPPRAREPPSEAPKANEPWDQPPSRFSVTTYATSAPDTPRESTETQRPPVPALPTAPPKDGVMNRKRPPVLGHTSPSLNPDEPYRISMTSPYMSTAFADTTPTPARAQLPSQKQPMPRASNSSMYSAASGRPDSVCSMSKALPPPPTEVSMVNDRVGYLNARLESLGNRRININQAIKQMTELMPTDSILASEAVLRKREAEKRKVEALKVELAEVQREEYEIGLKLHRAYKRMDRNAEYEPTTLWVRRVTG